MEHSCRQCGAVVEDGLAFCRHCQTPQIRVSIPSSPEPETPSLQQSERPLTRHDDMVHPSGLIWRHALPAAAQAGLIAAVLMIVPLGASVILGMLAAGFLSVLFYHRRDLAANLTNALGARLGALSGMIGFGIFAVLSALETALFRTGSELRTALLQALDQAASRNADPQAQQMVAYLKSPQGLALFMIFCLIAMFVLFLILSTLGGVIAASFLRKKEHP